MDPLSLLPKSTLVLDEWKRTYSNTKPTYNAAMPWFWEHLDKAGYTLWSQKYKYNEENKKDFMTSNLVGGFIQRSEEMRKYAFGVMHVLNTSAPFEVEGCWIMRGAEDGLKMMLDSNPDAEYYEWTKLDADAPATRALVEDYWCSQEKLTTSGKDVYDCRQFKVRGGGGWVVGVVVALVRGLRASYLPPQISRSPPFPMSSIPSTHLPAPPPQ